MKLASIPAGQAFLDTVAARWRAAHADPSVGLILLPTRRAARALADAFTVAASGAPQLLPGSPRSAGLTRPRSRWLASSTCRRRCPSSSG